VLGDARFRGVGWLWLVGSIKLQVAFAKEPYKRENILQKKPIIQSILLTVANPYGVGKWAQGRGPATLAR